MDKYVIFGATGKVGKEVISYFSRAGIPCVAVTRNPASIRELPYVTWEVADLADQERLHTVLQDAAGVFIATSVSPDMVMLHANAIAAAKAAGARHIVKLSTRSALENPEGGPAAAHAQTDQLIRECGILYTTLHPTSFMQGRLEIYAATVRAEGKIYEAAGDTRIPFIDTRDIAEVAFTVLTSPEKHLGKSYILTGGEALNYYELAALISEALGQTVTYIAETPEQARARMEREGRPPGMISFYLSWIKSQQTVVITDNVAAILGKPPRSMKDLVKEYFNHPKNIK